MAPPPPQPTRTPPPADAFLAHVERVFADRPRAVATLLVPPAPAPAAPAPARSGTPVALRCRCGWSVECLPADRARFVRRGCLLCGGPVSDGPIPADSTTPGDARRRPRRRPRGGARVEVRRTTDDGAGPDLALALADVCAEGVGVWLTGPVRVGETVVVTLATSPVRGAVVTADVRWCARAKDWTYRAGLHLGRPLAAEALAEVAL